MRRVKDIRELRKIQINILKYVHNVCEKNKLDYFLCGGSLLGAVRHQGYIPWDDDIDIMMPRKDYEKLTRIINSERSSPFCALTYYNCLDLGNAHTKISDTRTAVIYKRYYRVKKLGVNIDVFPYDGLPNSETEIREVFGKISSLRNLLYRIVSKEAKADKKPNAPLPKLRVPIVFLICLYIDTIAKKYSVDNSDKVACVMAIRGGEREIIDRNAFEKRDLVSFENGKFYIPHGYHEYLTNQYRDYMKLPPISQRRIAHGSIAWWK